MVGNVIAIVLSCISIMFNVLTFWSMAGTYYRNKNKK